MEWLVPVLDEEIVGKLVDDAVKRKNCVVVIQNSIYQLLWQVGL